MAGCGRRPQCYSLVEVVLLAFVDAPRSTLARVLVLRSGGVVSGVGRSGLAGVAPGLVRSWVPMSSVSSSSLVLSVSPSWSDSWSGLWGGLVIGKAVSEFPYRVSSLPEVLVGVCNFQSW